MRRVALFVTLVSVAIWALIAVVALVGGGFGDTQWKILGSSMLVTAAAVVGMACAVPLQAGRLGPIPWVGIAASLAGFGMTIVGIWSEFSWEVGGKVAGSLILIAVAVGVIGLIDQARLRAGHKWVVTVSQLLIGLAAALVISAIWGEIDNEWFWRTTGIVLVLTAAGAVSVPILHRMADIPAASVDGSAPRVTNCPLCGAAADGLLTNRIACSGCGREFRVIV